MSNPIQECAEAAVEQLQALAGGKLDYSPESLTIVEELLEEASSQWLSKESREALIELLGCYILEVGMREHGGRYGYLTARQQPVLIVGEPNFVVSMITFDKVRGRLSGDLADHIPFFYEGFSERV